MQERIPRFNASGVLPPYVGCSPAQPAPMMSPYVVNVVDLVERFGFSRQRRIMLRGLLAYREALCRIGMRDGFQWLNGSFLEDIESRCLRAPGDIDVVTFSRRPAAHREPEAWTQFSLNHCSPLQDRMAVRARYHCDAFMVDLDGHPELLVDSVRYWFGLFSHHRISLQWKGMLRVSLADDFDPAAKALLNQMEDDDDAA